MDERLPARASAAHADVPADFAHFIQSDSFPCAGGKSALSLDRLVVVEAGLIIDDAHDERLHEALRSFAAAERASETAPRSFVVLFSDAEPMSEEAFEAALWARLQALHDLDVARGIGWALNVASAPDSPRFCMSVGGAAYFVVGLHPGASRGARRFSRPALAFNPHEQFERLRADGRYAQIQAVNRQRELAQHGSINPMLSEFGSGREAAQYSGREVGESWRCPFMVRR